MINEFTGKYRFLSNFYPVWVTFEDAQYPSVEHAYQAAKTTDFNSRLPFMEGVVTANEAKKLGKKIKLREDWEQVKVPIMLSLLREKFQQPKFAKLLLSTGDKELIEGNWWGDIWWGYVKGLGKIGLANYLCKSERN